MAIPERRSRNRARLTRKELKAPDEFLTLTARFLSFASDHLRLLSISLGSIVVALLLVWGLLYYLERNEQRAFATLFQVNAQLGNVESGTDSSPILVDQLKQITQTLGAGRARGFAQLYLGHIHYREGDYTAAVAAYRQALTQVDHASVIWPLAALGVAYALEGSGDLKEAQGAYQHVIDANPSGFVIEAYVGKARAAEDANDLETAIAAYSAVIEKFPLQAEALEIADKVAVLKAKR